MHAWRENSSFMMKQKEIGWRIGQLRQRMGVEPGKGFFFPGALAIAGKSRRHVSYMQTKPPYIGLHRCIAFFFPLRPHLISLPFKKERKRYYIYHI